MDLLDTIEWRFLSSFSILFETAFMEYHVALLSFRKQICALELIHRGVLKKALRAVFDFFIKRMHMFLCIMHDSKHVNTTGKFLI